MDRVMNFDAALLALLDASNRAHAAGEELAQIVRDMPRTTEDLESALLELREANRMKDDNFRRWPRREGTRETGIYNDSEECREHWSEACEREWKAVSRLGRIAEAIAIARAERAA